jgi:hypothetical protein
MSAAASTTGSRKSLRDLSPPARLLALPALRGHAGDSPSVAVTIPPALLGCPPALACCASEVTVDLRTADDDLAAVRMALADGTTHSVLAEPFRLISALVIWDESIRQQDVFRGHVYLASDYSVEVLLRTSDCAPPTDLAALLDQLQNLELVYRFPVALKFRGRYSLERQCRANGWGRLLHRTVVESRADHDWLERCRQRLTQHIQQYRDAYRQGIVSACRADDQSDTGFWDQIHETQPIPIVI